MSDWIKVTDELPPEDLVVETKISDEKGERNETELLYWRNMWWDPGKNMYMYYVPTHWKRIKYSW